MGGYKSSSGGSPGSGGTKRQAKSYQKKNEPTPVKDFIAGGGITGAIIRGVSGAIKHQKTKNRKSTSGDVYAGEAYGYNEAKEKKDTDAMKKFASRTTRLTPDMVEEAKKLAEGRDAIVIQADLGSDAGLKHLIDSIDGQNIDLLIHNASLYRKEDFE